MYENISPLLVHDELGLEIKLNDNCGKALAGSITKTNYPETNSNNISLRDDNEISYWEEFNMEENNLISQLEDAAASNENQNDFIITKRENISSKDAESFDNFEIIVSDEEENNLKHINRPKTYKSIKCCENDLLFGNIGVNEATGKCLIRQIYEFAWTIFHEFCHKMNVIYMWFVLMLNISYLNILKRSCQFRTYASSSSVCIVPFKIIPNLIQSGCRMMKKYFLYYSYRKLPRGKAVCKLTRNNEINSAMNSNNNAVELCKEKTSTIFCMYIFCIAVMTGGLFIHCWFKPESRVCSINYLTNKARIKANELLHEIYILPGQDCMKAAKCCKGCFEATFRWVNCLFTLPIRSALTVWPRQSDENEATAENESDIKIHVEKIIQELKDAKDRTIRQDEFLLKLRHQFSILEKLIQEKSKDIVKLEPQLKMLKKIVQEMSIELKRGLNQMKNAISFKQESNKIIENMKIIARDSSNSLKASIARVEAKIETEQHKLNTRVEMLESMLSDVQVIQTESNQPLKKIQTDLENLKVNQVDLDSKLKSLNDIPEQYKKMSEKLKLHVKVKLAEELAEHNRMSKETEGFCLLRINNFKEELEKSKSEFTCFIESQVIKEANEINRILRGEISLDIYDKTMRIAKSVVEEVLSKQGYKGSTRHIVKSGVFLPELRKIEPAPFSCHFDNVDKLLNYSAFCLDNKSLNETMKTNEECLSDKQIKKMVKIAVAKYSADKIGLADFALESMGGSAIASRSSSTYNGHLGLFSFFTIRASNSLRTIIQPGNQPGDCWPFTGSKGHVVIKLSHRILVSAVTLEHLSASLNPDGNIISAPKQFQIFTLSEHSFEKQDLVGTFEYVQGDQSIQTFLVEKPRIGRLIQMDVLSNHGNEEYTCIYRLRIHGQLHDAGTSM